MIPADKLDRAKDIYHALPGEKIKPVGSPWDLAGIAKRQKRSTMLSIP
jgi:hypothetical protein